MSETLLKGATLLLSPYDRWSFVEGPQQALPIHSKHNERPSPEENSPESLPTSYLQSICYISVPLLGYFNITQLAISATISAIIYGTIWTHEQAPKVIHSFKCFLDHASILLPVLRANSDDQYHVIFNELLTFITQKVNWY